MSTTVATQDQIYEEQLSRSRADQLREDSVMIDNAIDEAGSLSVPQKSLIGGPGYWVMLMTAACVDLIGILLDFLMVFTIFATLLSYTMLGIIWLYYYFHDVKISGSKQKTFVISTIAESIPLFNAFSFLSFSFWLMRKQENKERLAFNKRMLASSATPNSID